MRRTLAETTDSEIPAYFALLSRGLSVYREPSAVTESGMCWVAEADGRQFAAEDPLSLLGLVAMHEARGASWRATNEEAERFLAAFGDA